MSAIHDLIAQIEDKRLRERLLREVKSLSENKKFGLVFEEHLPELTPVWSATAKKGDLVVCKGAPLADTWLVKKVIKGEAHCHRPEGEESREIKLSELVVVRQFGDPIFPSLVPIDAVENGNPESPWHTLIEADNYHALQLLEYLYGGMVDCIYIDPPYNSGARDWKYNNDYVDKNDSWRHSKWLSMMEKRLRLARHLLKPDTGVLVVTIDENEVHHLGMLLETWFPDFIRQMVTIVINPKGTGKLNFARVEEHALYCIPDVEGGVIKGIGGDEDEEELQTPSDDSHLDPNYAHLWELRHARRRGAESSYRHQRYNQFYPIYICEKDKKVVRAGPSIPLGEDPSFEITDDGLTPIWPIDHEGNHRCWRFIAESMQSLIDLKRVVLGKYNKKKGTWTVNIWERKPTSKKMKTVWWESKHDAGTHGTTLLHNVLGNRGEFAFPKSIYAVRDCLTPVIGPRKDALVVDFFAGSGTTLNAVNLMNLADGGNRQCIMVTNNDVSGNEADNLRKKKIQPGEDAWEEYGICKSVTWPRSKFTIFGKRDDGTSLPGEYLTGKTTEREGTRKFIQIGFLTAEDLVMPPKGEKKKKKQLVNMIDGLPQTLVTDDCKFVVSEKHKASIIFDPDVAEDWLAALEDTDHITDFYIVAPENKIFNGLKAQVNELLGPQIILEEEKRPLADGFAANLAYFKLDFLDKDQVALQRRFKEILPLLWLKAGAIGPRPELKANKREPEFLIPEYNAFAVLLEEKNFSQFVAEIIKRPDLTHVFIVTDADDAFKEMAREVEDRLKGTEVVQLYRDYLENFMINRGHGS